MDTSKDYYETVMRDFKTYGRGRTLEQYCRDEAVDYKWIDKAKELYGTPAKTKTEKKARSRSTDMIQLVTVQLPFLQEPMTIHNFASENHLRQLECSHKSN